MYVLSFSEQAKEELLQMQPPFRSIILSFLEKQVENSNTPFFSGHRVSDNGHEWFFDFGVRRIMAYIDEGEVIILGFLLNEHHTKEEYIENSDLWETKRQFTPQMKYEPLTSSRKYRKYH